MKKGLIIAIDGPAGSGKSTVSKLVAKKLGYTYIDTGAMYRALTLKALNTAANLKDQKALVRLSAQTKIDLKNYNDGAVKVFLDEQEVSREIRTLQVTNNISYLARTKGVRANMVKLQRKLGKNGWAVLEGRDIGTVVFPDADCKFYLDASIKERARRRYQELKEAGEKVSLKNLEQEIKIRDTHDKTRKVAPLKMAEDAIYIDTTKLSINEVVNKILNQVNFVKV